MNFLTPFEIAAGEDACSRYKRSSEKMVIKLTDQLGERHTTRSLWKARTLPFSPRNGIFSASKICGFDNLFAAKIEMRFLTT
jgi:hypothetical protein